ncbi:hypothetical protein L2E82_36384 [Cichorium intybus]|uniref:Uncharacterized protein n=1 Tax=Cichorium intybus TaxID=13427 RepID=A0ACB9BRF2_CICIN|nr:hypothetical protein L2E82_36384 [Cichorium intybus]
MFAKAMNELDLDLEVFRYPAINKPAGVVHWTSRRDILLEYVKNVQPEFMELFVKRAPQQTSRRDILLEYVKNVQPEFMELFVKRAPQQVVDAMRQTVTNMIGTLPPQFFAVTVTTVAENLAQLMYSVLMTGYMFRNAQYPLELQQSLDQDAPDYAPPGAQKKLLEAEVEELNRQVETISANGSNELLDSQNLKDLTSSAGEDVVVAMNTFIKRLLAVSDPSQMKTSVTETSAPELAKLLYWLMVVGYSIRNIEVRFDMERVLGSPPKRQELPPAENI